MIEHTLRHATVSCQAGILMRSHVSNLAYWNNCEGRQIDGDTFREIFQVAEFSHFQSMEISRSIKDPRGAMQKCPSIKILGRRHVSTSKRVAPEIIQAAATDSIIEDNFNIVE